MINSDETIKNENKVLIEEIKILKEELRNFSSGNLVVSFEV
jgi:hypothetical protein